MSNRLCLIVLMASILCTADLSSAQDAVAVSPEIYTVLFENDDIRVMELTYQPGERDAPHSHPKYTVLVLEAGTLRVHPQEGEAQDIVVQRGQTSLLDPVERHWAENVGETVVRAVAVEFKH